MRVINAVDNPVINSVNNLSWIRHLLMTVNNPVINGC